MKKFLFALVTAVVLALPFAVSAQSAVPNPIVLTEDAINSAWRVTNPSNRSVDDLSVDLQPDQSVVSATITLRRPRGGETTTLETVAVYSAEIRSGRLYWTLESATVNGTAATADQLSIINTAITSSYRNYVRSNIRAGRLTDVVITDSDIQFFYE